ncbi:DUF6335 family protein (plasmid) [Kovacikia minuta CCNUW1]|uniref:DUF6335 family protein n=1 Tax=Kovacikia minuta TaxID=2931930 RepID=UPI001CCF054A|nr:DUF6335 family protein [Kovacikia minuta]UBF30593.1 DUF6335 family protein [Kovacikia minuta CCNUW1]
MVSKKRSSDPEQTNKSFQPEAGKGVATEVLSSDRPIGGSEEIEDLEAEVGMKEVELDQDIIDTVAVDDDDDSVLNDDLDADKADDIDDGLEPDEVIDDRPQELTESYGTGLQGVPSDRAGTYSRREPHLFNEPEFTLTGGDVDANAEDADAVGEEAVGGTVATPDQDIVEELAAAVGIQTDDRSFLRTNDMLEQRDDRRWELDPQSAEDYKEHQE